MKPQKSLQQKVLEQMKVRLVSQIKALSHWIEGNHDNDYFAFFNKMREDMNSENSLYKKDSVLFQKDFDHLNQLEANYKKQMKMMLDGKSGTKLAKLRWELVEVNNSLYYYQLEK